MRLLLRVFGVEAVSGMRMQHSRFGETILGERPEAFPGQPVTLPACPQGVQPGLSALKAERQEDGVVCAVFLARTDGGGFDGNDAVRRVDAVGPAGIGETSEDRGGLAAAWHRDEERVLSKQSNPFHLLLAEIVVNR